jgi:hypothetical protein
VVDEDSDWTFLLCVGDARLEIADALNEINSSTLIRRVSLYHNSRLAARLVSTMSSTKRVRDNESSEQKSEPAKNRRKLKMDTARTISVQSVTFAASTSSAPVAGPSNAAQPKGEAF